MDDDGHMVEPIYYLPIIPMILVNGAKGIGTGFSTDIPCFNPKQLIDYILKKMKNHSHIEDFIPYYEGFKGTIEQVDSHKFITKGVYKIQKTKVIISELPIGLWNEDYLQYLEKCIQDNVLKDYKDQSTDKEVYFELMLKKEMDEDEIIKMFKLTTTLSTTNMNLFDYDDKLKHYDKVHEICDDFMDKRLDYYEKRRLYLIELYEKEKIILENKYNYIREILNDTLDLRKKSSSQINELLESKHYIKQNDSYNYLIKMTMDSVCEENVKSLKNQFDEKNKQLEEMKNTNNCSMWEKELTSLKEIL